MHAAAVRLTVEHGLDRVTIDAIAEAANISRRTFSNYFARKEDAVLYGEQLYNRAFARALSERPADEEAWAALRAATRDLYASWTPRPDREWALRTRLARKHPSLLAQQLANQAALSHDLEEALTGRASAGRARPGVLATVFLAALRVAMNTWIDEEEARDLLEVVDEVLDEAEEPFAQ